MMASPLSVSSVTSCSNRLGFSETSNDVNTALQIGLGHGGELVLHRTDADGFHVYIMLDVAAPSSRRHHLGGKGQSLAP